MRDAEGEGQESIWTENKSCREKVK